MTKQPQVDEKHRKFLTESEIKRLLDSARRGRHGTRDYLIVLLFFRYALRISELIDLRIEDIDLDAARIHVRRRKGSLSTIDLIGGDELRAVRAYLRERGDTKVPYLLVGERGPLTRHTVKYLVKKMGQRAELGVNVYPQMLRHSAAYYLVNKGVDIWVIKAFLGHKNINHTAKYYCHITV